MPIKVVLRPGVNVTAQTLNNFEGARVFAERRPGRGPYHGLEIIRVDHARFLYQDDEDNPEKLVTPTTFEFVNYMLDNVHDCKWIEIYNSDYQPVIYSLIGRTKTKRPHLGGYIISLWLGYNDKCTRTPTKGK